MGSSSILPSAGEAEAAAGLRKWKVQDALTVDGTWWGGGYFVKLGTWSPLVLGVSCG